MEDEDRILYTLQKRGRLTMEDTLVRAEHLKKYFPAGRGHEGRYVKAVDDVSFEIKRGEFLGVVGESGCGKSTLGRCVIKLLEPSEGRIYYDGEDITGYGFRQMKKMRPKMQMVFQNPFSSFNPKKTIYDSLLEVGNYYRMPKEESIARIQELVGYINLDESVLHRRPTELSGGQLQRLAIARALILKPEFIMADEPVSALDVSVQAQVLNIIMDLREKEKLTMMFISHELTVVEHICDRIIVMYLGSIVEMGDTREVIRNPLHPYTQVLLSSKPKEDPLQETNRILLKGEIPNAVDMPEGCKFWTRCSYYKEYECETAPLVQAANNHWVACPRCRMTI